MSNIFKLSSIDKFVLFGYIIKGITGVVGGCLVLEQNHPYITLGILALGAAAMEAVNYIEKKQNSKIQEQ